MSQSGTASVPFVYLARTAAIAACVAALPPLLLLVYVVLTDTTGETIPVQVMIAFVPGLLVLLGMLYLVIGAVDTATIEANPGKRSGGLRMGSTTVSWIAFVLSAVPWLIWLREKGWPFSNLETYVRLIVSLIGVWAILMPGALLQARMLGRHRARNVIRQGSSFTT